LHDIGSRSRLYHSLRCRSENDHEIDGLDDESELACRIMLVNLLRLLGAVKAEPDTSRPSTLT
ncbi:hypothetical protein BC827DRAFT_1250252, partial [Russula dissimulans]